MSSSDAYAVPTLSLRDLIFRPLEAEMLRSLSNSGGTATNSNSTSTTTNADELARLSRTTDPLEALSMALEISESLHMILMQCNRGPPPASLQAISALPTMSLATQPSTDTPLIAGITEEAGQLRCQDDSRECGICFERLVDGLVLKRMPCGHLYHKGCLDEWLSNRSCTCPECRYEIETGDYTYELGRLERMKNRRIVTCSCPSTLHSCFFQSVQDISDHCLDRSDEKE